MAHQKMLEMYGKEQAYTSGYKVYLTTPSFLQSAAEKAREEAMKAIAGSSGEFDYAAVSLQLAEAEARLRAIQQLKRGQFNNRQSQTVSS